MIISFIVLILISLSLINLLKLTSFTEKSLSSFLISTGLIIIWANTLSAFSQLNKIISWIIISLATLIVYYLFLHFVLKRNNQEIFSCHIQFNSPFRKLKQWYSSTKLSEKLILWPLVLTFFLITSTNILLILFTAPFNWDSMTYHLARMAYFLQHNNFSYFESNYWAQVVHPTNATSLLTYVYLLSEKNENLTQLVQFFAYLISVLSVFGISKKIGNTTSQSVMASMVAGLLTEWLLQSTTTQNDMIITSLVGLSTYFIFSYHHSMNKRDLWLSGMSVGIMVGVKSSSLLPIACIALIVFILIFKESGTLKDKFIHIVQYGLIVLIALLAFAMPSGYLENIRMYKHPLGPVEVREMHSFEGQSLGYVLKFGSVNVLRYGFEFLSLDGLSGELSNDIQHTLRHYPFRALQKVGIHIESAEATRKAFSPDKKPVAQEDKSYWGLFGFSLIWIAVIITVFRFDLKSNAFILALTAILFLVLQSYSGPYDPWRGRYFIICAIFAAPLIGHVFPIHKFPIFLYVFIIVVLGCTSAFSTVLFRENSPLIVCTDDQCKFRPIFQENRLQQLTATRPELFQPMQEYDEIVPTDATVAVLFPTDSYEYPLFGEKLTRTIIPINSFFHGLQPLPENADYLLYTSDLLPDILPEDISIGQNLYLRNLSQ